MSAVQFVSIDVEPCEASEMGITLRFKRTDSGASRVVNEAPYESEQGLEGRWLVRAIDGEDDEGRPASAYEIEDSSDGTVWVIAGGAFGLRLTHVETGAVAREPYLLLSLRAALA